MKLWRLLPRSDERSGNWKRSHYDGNFGAVIVRARTTYDARNLAAELFERHEWSVDLANPWLEEADTIVEQCDDPTFPAEGEAKVLQPTLAQVKRPEAGDDYPVARRKLHRA